MYGTAVQVASGFDPGQWDPERGTPTTATVTAWLGEESEVLDGEIGGAVSVPVSSSASPKLHAVCARVAVLRTMARVFDQISPPGGGEQVAARPSRVWRDEANRLADNINKGRTADGAPVGGRGPEGGGAPEAATETSGARFTRDQRF